MTKITVDTVKSFIAENLKELYINVHCAVGYNPSKPIYYDNEFYPARLCNSVEPEDCGIHGVWFTNRPFTEMIDEYNEKDMTGFTVANSCGSFTVAIKI